MLYTSISRQVERKKKAPSSEDELSLSDEEEATVVKIERRLKHNRTTRSTSQAPPTQQKGSQMVKTSIFLTQCDN